MRARPGCRLRTGVHSQDQEYTLHQNNHTLRHQGLPSESSWSICQPTAPACPGRPRGRVGGCLPFLAGASNGRVWAGGIRAGSDGKSGAAGLATCERSAHHTRLFLPNIPAAPHFSPPRTTDAHVAIEYVVHRACSLRCSRCLEGNGNSKMLLRGIGQAAAGLKPYTS